MGSNLLTISEIGKNPKYETYIRKTPDEIGDIDVETISGVPSGKRSVHKYIGFNQFERKITTIPKGYYRQRKVPDKKWFKDYIYNPSRTLAEKKLPPEAKKKYTVYTPDDNGGTPFYVYVSPKEDEISVYTIPKTSYIPKDDEDDPGKEYYTERVFHAYPKKIYIGKSPKNNMTEFSCGHGKKFDGNTILVDMGNNEYVYIQAAVEWFKSLASIVRYVSPVGNDRVPYPFAVDSKKNYYLLGYGVYITNVDENVYLSPPKCKGCATPKKEKASEDPYWYFDDLGEKSPKVKKLKFTKTIRTGAY